MGGWDHKQHSRELKEKENQRGKGMEILPFLLNRTHNNNSSLRIEEIWKMN